MSLPYKRRRRRSDHSVDDWLMTYADMITLLLCFFAIFLSVSVPKDEQFEKARAQVMERFAAPNVLEGKAIPNTNAAGHSDVDPANDALPSIVDLYHTGEGRSVGAGIDAGEGQSQGMGEGEKSGTSETATDGQNQEVWDGMVHEPTEEAQNAGADGKKPQPGEGDKAAKEGDRIKMIEMPSAAFFTSGSAQLSPEGGVLLQQIIDKDLKAADLQGFQITVEGHTDDVPINTLQFPSNWELSTARAAAVVRFFIEHGVDPQRLRAAGYADVLPKAPNRDANGTALPANQAQNRRVVIKLEKIEKAP